MSALKTPAPDAPAAEWGHLAERIPGWRWPDGMHWAAPGFVASSTGSSPTSNVRQFVRVGFTPIYPDPDHWAWEGWMLRLLGPENVRWSKPPYCRGGWAPRAVRGWNHELSGLPLGRSCIAAAAALGRWPGGEG